MKVDYNYDQNEHGTHGPQKALPILLEDLNPISLLDVGCGNGTWISAAQMMGISDFIGVDGNELASRQLLFPPSHFKMQDLTKEWCLNRKFDVAICLEVAEHLDERYASVLIDTLIKHSSVIVFSAASPNQPGQHHVNLQWPKYWQELFNQHGYSCTDSLRWKIWDDDTIEPWYRQNVMKAIYNPEMAGREPRIPSVIHPEIMKKIILSDFRFRFEKGELPFRLYVTTTLTAISRRVFKRLKANL